MSFKRLRPLIICMILWFTTQTAFSQMAQISQDPGRQIVIMKKQWAREGNFINILPDKENIFFMGDSKVMAGIIPKLFDKENQDRTHSYNISLPGLPLAPHYFWLRNYLARGGKAPDYILINLKKAGWNFFNFAGYSILRADPDEALQYYWASRNEDILINYFIPLRYNWPLAKRYLIGRLYQIAPPSLQAKFIEAYCVKQIGRETYPHDWRLFFEMMFVHPGERVREREKFVEDQRGYYQFREAQAKGGILPDNYIYEKKGDWGEGNDELNDPFVEKFFRLTQKHGIRVILFNTYLLESQKEDRQGVGIPALWQEAIRKYPHVAYSEKGKDFQIYPNRYFSDPLHLTREGAEIFTRQAGEIFRDAKHKWKASDEPLSL